MHGRSPRTMKTLSRHVACFAGYVYGKIGPRKRLPDGSQTCNVWNGGPRRGGALETRREVGVCGQQLNA